MFTGIIEAVGRVRTLGESEMWLDVPFAPELKLGQSVACDGICLTVVEVDADGFRVEFLEETKRLTSLGDYSEGFFVNVERAMKVSDRFDGHIVQAHVEGVGELLERDKEDSGDDRDDCQNWLLSVSVPEQLVKYMIHKGIIILNGIALTIVEKDTANTLIKVAIIPHTWENTNLQYLELGAQINVETDVLAKYMENMMSS